MRSEDGLDELSINAPTRVTTVTRTADGASLAELVVEPRSIGIRPAPMDDLAASDVGDAVRIARALLLGEDGPKRDMLVLNAGAALLVAGAAGSLEEGRQLADRALSSGAALRTLDALVRISNEPAM